MTVRGIYRDGRIELAEDPRIAGEAVVVVTFPELSRTSNTSPQMMTSGMLATPGRSMSTEAEFRDAEYDDSEWDRE
jgi:hypothetical protein